METPLRPRGAAAALAAAAALVLAAPAAALPVTVFFDGPTDASGQNWGISDAGKDALVAKGVSLIAPPVYDVDGSLGVVDQDLQRSSVIIRLFVRQSSVTSMWTAGADRDLAGDVYLLFAAPEPYSLTSSGGPVSVSYAPDNVGLTIDPAAANGDSWVLVQTTDPVLGTLYYPGISLGSLIDGETTDPFAVNYALRRQLLQNVNGDLALPQFHLLMAFVPVPEPSTAALFALGLGALAWRRRARP